MNLAALQPENIRALSDEQFRELLVGTIGMAQEDRKQSQILYYQPVSDKVQDFHDSAARVNAIGGGNGSGKSESALVELVMCATGVFPYSQRHLIGQKFRGPIQTRLVVESLTTTLETIILPKLMWWRWTGVDEQGGERGHWGWIPKDCLIDGDWQKSYSQKLRVLRVYCRDPENPDRILGESTIQCMSFDQDPPDFASGDFQLILHDEPPSLAIWRENEARTMRVAGRMLLAMTWPDDPAINVDWLYNEVYEPGRAGNDPDIKWTELWTTENKNLKQEAVAAQAGKWSAEMAAVRIYGRPIRFSNRIHHEFTDTTKTWCFECDKAIIPVPLEYGVSERMVCPHCQSQRVGEYNHVRDFETAHAWPTVYLLDMHPRKPHDYLWVQVSPSDDWFVVAEGKCDGDCADVRKDVTRIEQELQLNVVQKLCDPNMGASPAGQKRGVTWQQEFSDAGLHCDLADDSSAGRKRINTMLKPDRDTLSPRLIVHSRCKDTIYQIQRYSWENYSSKVDKDEKQTPKAKYDDKPTLLKYFANSNPNFHFLKSGGVVIKRTGTRRGGY